MANHRNQLQRESKENNGEEKVHHVKKEISGDNSSAIAIAFMASNEQAHRASSETTGDNSSMVATAFITPAFDFLRAG